MAFTAFAVMGGLATVLVLFARPLRKLMTTEALEAD